MSGAPPPLLTASMRAWRGAVVQSNEARAMGACRRALPLVSERPRKSQRQPAAGQLPAARNSQACALACTHASARRGQVNSNSARHYPAAASGRAQHQHPARPAVTPCGVAVATLLAPSPQGVPASHPPRKRGSPESKATSTARLASGASRRVGIAPHLPACFIRSPSRPSPCGCAARSLDRAAAGGDAQKRKRLKKNDACVHGFAPALTARTKRPLQAKHANWERCHILNASVPCWLVANEINNAKSCCI